MQGILPSTMKEKKERVRFAGMEVVSFVDHGQFIYIFLLLKWERTKKHEELDLGANTKDLNAIPIFDFMVHVLVVAPYMDFRVDIGLAMVVERQVRVAKRGLEIGNNTNKFVLVAQLASWELVRDDGALVATIDNPIDPDRARLDQPYLAPPHSKLGRAAPGPDLDQCREGGVESHEGKKGGKGNRPHGKASGTLVAKKGLAARISARHFKLHEGRG